jgi:hypothetical protein
MAPRWRDTVLTETSSRQWSSRYESLRTHALPDADVTDSGWGLALFMRRGTVAWMEAWPSIKEADGKVTTGTDGAPCPQSSRVTIPKELVMVLAEIITGCWQEVAA